MQERRSFVLEAEGDIHFLDSYNQWKAPDGKDRLEPGDLDEGRERGSWVSNVYSYADNSLILALELVVPEAVRPASLRGGAVFDAMDENMLVNNIHSSSQQACIVPSIA